MHIYTIFELNRFAIVLISNKKFLCLFNICVYFSETGKREGDREGVRERERGKGKKERESKKNILSSIGIIFVCSCRSGLL